MEKFVKNAERERFWKVFPGQAERIRRKKTHQVHCVEKPVFPKRMGFDPGKKRFPCLSWEKTAIISFGGVQK